MDKPLSRKEYEEIYAKLGDVSPIDGDCGKLCAASCCSLDGKYPEGIKNEDYVMDDAEDEADGELGIYLLPGEDALHDKGDSWLKWSEEDALEAGFPESWTGKVQFVKCHGAEKCRRDLRPIQCRTFPVAPYLTHDGKLKLILYTDTLPYKCPLVYGAYHLRDDFLKATFSAWSRLIQDQRIFDLVMEDSRFRDECEIPLEFVYE